jgi:hypothetical protein
LARRHHPGSGRADDGIGAAHGGGLRVRSHARPGRDRDPSRGEKGTLPLRWAGQDARAGA